MSAPPFLTLALLVLAMTAAAEPVKPRYIEATAYHILPGTHNNESGYFSLCEGLDGSIYIGTAKYGENAYLVEFDPRSEKQRIVIDVNKLCGLSGKGYAAQAKIHTRNFVSPSGKVYVGSKQGYRQEGDKSEYPGGYVMVYDPRTGEATNLGMPLKGQGVIDVVADEEKGRLYVVTCEDQHWMLGDVKGGPYRELGPMLTPYAATLLDAKGGACAVTKDFSLARYDPATGKIETRPIEVDGKKFIRADANSIPIWQLAADRRHAYLILMNDPTLLEIDLLSEGPAVKAVSHGKMIEGKHPDCRGAMSVAPDGQVYAFVRVDNETGFGTGYLHHLARYNPKAAASEDLGVVVVKNPNFFDFDKRDAEGKPPPYSHGFHKLPDGTLTPLHVHMAMMVAHDGTVYATIIYPFTLLRIEAFKPARAEASPAQRALDSALTACGRAEKELPRMTKVAEVVAERHMGGGLIGFPFAGSALAMELWGRSGGIVHVGFDRPFKKDRSEAERARDVAIVGYDRAPGANDLAEIRKLKGRGCYLIGFGPREMPALQEMIAECDAWFDSGPATDAHGGRAHTLANAIDAWAFTAEVVSALTRRGKMPTMWKSYLYEDGKEWGGRYLGKKQFHDDFQVPPIAAGELGAQFLAQIRNSLRSVRETQAKQLADAGRLAAAEVAAGRKVIIAWQGHMPPDYIGKFDDAWAQAAEVHPFLQQQLDAYDKSTPDGALVVNLGYTGPDARAVELWRKKKQRVIFLAGAPEDPVRAVHADFLQQIDLAFAHGDACVSVEGYPIRLFPPSGIMQLAGYDAIVAEVHAH